MAEQAVATPVAMTCGPNLHAHDASHQQHLHTYAPAYGELLIFSIHQALVTSDMDCGPRPKERCKKTKRFRNRSTENESHAHGSGNASEPGNRVEDITVSISSSPFNALLSSQSAFSSTLSSTTLQGNSRSVSQGRGTIMTKIPQSHPTYPMTSSPMDTSRAPVQPSSASPKLRSSLPAMHSSAAAYAQASAFNNFRAPVDSALTRDLDRDSGSIPYPSLPVAPRRKERWRESAFPVDYMSDSEVVEETPEPGVEGLAKKKLGRPRKEDSSSTSQPTTALPAETPEDAVLDMMPPKRKRGRPRKGSGAKIPPSAPPMQYKHNPTGTASGSSTGALSRFPRPQSQPSQPQPQFSSHRHSTSPVNVSRAAESNQALRGNGYSLETFLDTSVPPSAGPFDLKDEDDPSGFLSGQLGPSTEKMNSRRENAHTWVADEMECGYGEESGWR